MADVRWIAQPGELAELAATLGCVDAFAFDTEFHRERTYYPQLALLQVAWSDGLALVDPLAVDLRPLAPAFTGGALVVAHAAAQDLEVLDRACGTIPRRLFDTQVAAGFLGFSTPSLATLAQRILGVHLPKGDRLSDWRQRPLTDAQLDYAAADVAYLLELAEIIREHLEASGRLSWAEQECLELYAQGPQPQDPRSAWWKIKEARHLRGRARAVAQEVAAWRERTAASADRPVRTVLSDLAVLTIATKPPETLEALRSLRGLEGRVPRGESAEALLEAVGRGLVLDAEDLYEAPHDEVDRNLRPAASLVAAWSGQLARELRLDPALLSTRSDLHALLRGDRSGRLSKGWRADLVGEPIQRLVSGEAALAFDGRGGLVLESRSHEPVRVVAPLPAVDWGAGDAHGRHPRAQESGRSTSASDGPTTPE
jgi:ribonuclease D